MAPGATGSAAGSSMPEAGQPEKPDPNQKNPKPKVPRAKTPVQEATTVFWLYLCSFSLYSYNDVYFFLGATGIVIIYDVPIKNEQI